MKKIINAIFELLVWIAIFFAIHKNNIEVAIFLILMLIHNEIQISREGVK